ncbi:serine/threonine-protein phosphatase 7 long form homolog [Triticum aestivum]|uniref:serine/threonine-protein phosphatase 7 long form homolog n=1 Tax=Triticum aestivum TaxID=4565 RepID=UPI001D034866|nr:serine/threonine-protein phosphatase 7 long form homolog [Triticum aestivum]
MADGDGPWYDGLIDEWDKEHRARAIENGQVVVAMRMRGHSADDFDYDPRYEPYIRRLGLLPFVLQFKRRAPPVNHAALTALVDRWRPETHSFHLPCGELTMTLQDMAMISGLPINGQAVTGRVSVGNWRERTADLIGVQPEDPQEGKADTAKVRHSWLKLVRGNTNPCPQDANDVVVQQYARAYLWYVLTKVVFSDATGNSALWMFLEPLNNWDTQYSWGSAALAYLYRQLDLACRRKGGTSSLSGFVWSLSVWMWERIPVGRPDLKNPLMANPRGNHDGLHDDDPYRRPTLAYYWEQVTVYTGSSHVRYKCYMNELDTLTAEQVHWLPYVEDRDFDLNEMCTRDSHLWRARCPMICFFAVEWHFVDRVARQFGKRQGIPIEESKEEMLSLHRFDRRNNQDISDWANKHRAWIEIWNQRDTLVQSENRPHNQSAYQKYQVWYADRYRLKLKPGWTHEEWSELVSEDPETAEGYHTFNTAVRDTRGAHVDYAPMHDEMVVCLTYSNILGRELLLCVNDANVALSHPSGGALSERTLRSTMEKFKKRFHKMAAMLSCHGAQSSDVYAPGSRAARANKRRYVQNEEDIEEEVTQPTQGNARSKKGKAIAKTPGQKEAEEASEEEEHEASEEEEHTLADIVKRGRKK